MVQTTLDDIRKNDTARLFRDDADIMAIRPSAAPANNTRNLNTLFGVQDESKPRSFDPNGDSDAAILLRRSGYRQTDEKTREGVYHIDDARSDAKVVERAAFQAAQAAAANTFAAQAKSWWNSCTSAVGRIGDSIGNAVDSVTGYVSDKIDSFTSAAGDMWKSVKSGAANIGTSIANGFDSYVAKPAAAAADWVGDKASTYIAKPAAAAGSYLQEKASGAWSWAKSAVGYEDEKPAAAAARPAAQAAAPAAAAQPLAGQRNNVSSGFSLSSAFDSAVDGATSLLGWNAPAPKAAPAPHR